MSAAEYYQLYLELVSLYNIAFEFWLTITFAFLAAVYFAFSNIEKSLANLIMSIYGISGAVFTFRFLVGVQSTSRLIEDAAVNGIEPPPFLVDPWQGQIIIFSILLLMMFGTISSIYFAAKLKRT